VSGGSLAIDSPSGFLGLDLQALLKELVTGKADGEILGWVQARAKTCNKDDGCIRSGSSHELLAVSS